MLQVRGHRVTCCRHDPHLCLSGACDLVTLEGSVHPLLHCWLLVPVASSFPSSSTIPFSLSFAAKVIVIVGVSLLQNKRKKTKELTMKDLCSSCPCETLWSSARQRLFYTSFVNKIVITKPYLSCRWCETDGLGVRVCCQLSRQSFHRLCVIFLFINF